MHKKYLFTLLSILAIFGFMSFASAQTINPISPFVFSTPTPRIKALLSSSSLQVPSLASTGFCLVTDAFGVFSTSACGSGGGAITINGLTTSTFSFVGVGATFTTSAPNIITLTVNGGGAGGGSVGTSTIGSLPVYNSVNSVTGTPALQLLNGIFAISTSTTITTSTITFLNASTVTSTNLTLGLTGYLKGNGISSPVTANATIPSTDITGLGTLSTQNANAVAITGGTAVFTSETSTNRFTSNQVSTNATTTNLAVTGALSLPNSSVTNAELQNSSYTVSAGINLTGGGTASLGGSLTLNLNSAVSLTSITSTNAFFTNSSSTSATTTNLFVSGALNLPALSITNGELANSALTVTASTGLSGGGSVSLGGSTSLSLASAFTVTSVTTTNFFSTNASTTNATSSNLALLGVLSCNASNQALQTSAGGQVSCGTLTTGGGGGVSGIGTSTINFLPIYNTATTVTGTPLLQLVNGAFTITTNTTFLNATGTNEFLANQLTVGTTTGAFSPGQTLIWASGSSTSFTEISVANSANGNASQACLTANTNMSTPTTSFSALCSNNPNFNTSTLFTIGTGNDQNLMFNTIGNGEIDLVSATGTLYFMTGNTTTNAARRLSIDAGGNITLIGTSTLATTTISTSTISQLNFNFATGTALTLTNFTTTNVTTTNLNVSGQATLPSSTITRANIVSVTSTNIFATNVTTVNLAVTGLTNLASTTMTNGTTTNFAITGLLNVSQTSSLSTTTINNNAVSTTPGWAFLEPAGHMSIIFATSSSPTTTACGTTSTVSVVGSDYSGYVTAGTGATSCTVNFATRYANIPFCYVQDRTASNFLTVSSISTSSFTAAVTGLGGTVFGYQCFGFNEPIP